MLKFFAWLIRWFSKINRNICQSLVSRFPSLSNEEDYKKMLVGCIDRFISQRQFLRILEVGGIDRPLLVKSECFQFDGMDIEYKENCDKVYDHFVVQSIEQPINQIYDLIISITLFEHVPDNMASLGACFSALEPGGAMMHYVPSKWHPYAIILRLVGPRLQNIIISLLRHHSMEVTGYPAFFNLCSPREMEMALRQAGFGNIKIIPFYNATDYFAFFFPAFVMVLVFEKICFKFRIEFFCSGFIFTATRPDIQNCKVEESLPFGTTRTPARL